MFRVISRRFGSKTFDYIKELNPGIAFKIDHLGERKMLVPFNKFTSKCIVEYNAIMCEEINELESISTFYLRWLYYLVGAAAIYNETIPQPANISTIVGLFFSGTGLTLLKLDSLKRKDWVDHLKDEIEKNDKALNTALIGKDYAESLPEDWRVGKLADIKRYDWYIMDIPKNTGKFNYKGMNIVSI